MSKWTKSKVAAIVLSVALEIPLYVITWKATNLINPSSKLVGKLINAAGAFMIGDYLTHTAKQAALEDTLRGIKAAMGTDTISDGLHRVFFEKMSDSSKEETP